MYVRAQDDKRREVHRLKEAIAKQEMEYKNKMKQQSIKYEDTIVNLRKDTENLAFDNASTHQELVNAQR